MEKVKNTIVKLFAVIAVAVALLMCGVLLGCGLKTDDGADNITDDLVAPPTGVHLAAKIDEKEEYDIDDISIELLYGIDIDLFNSCRHGNVLKNGKEENVTRKLSIIAYDDSKYYDGSKSIDSCFDRKGLYNDLTALEIGGANDGAYFIEDIPFILDEWDLNGHSKDVYQHMSVENLKGTEYECTINRNPREYVCNKKIDIKLPRELFVSDSGYIYIDMVVLMEDNSDGNRIVFSELSNYGETVRFGYEKQDNKVKLPQPLLGSPFVVDGTKS